MVLWIIFAGLTTAAVAAVLWPFLRSRASGAGAGIYGAEVFKDQLDVIDKEEERGVIPPDEAEAARTEVARRLLAASEHGRATTRKKAQSPASNIPAFALVCIFVCIPLLSSALYLVYGSPGLPDQPLSARLEGDTGSQKVGALVARVEARLREHPEDGRGWEVIAPVYLKQRRFGDAADAYGRALRLLGETPERLAAYGNALVLANDGVVTEPARKALQKAVAEDSSLLRAHFWLAMAYEQDGRFSAAAESWRGLLERSGDNAPWREAVEQRLSAAEQKTGAPPGDTLKGPDEEAIAAARDMSAEDRGRMIAQMVSGLAERLRSEGGSVEEWKRLVRSYTVLGDRQAAAAALSEARSAYSEDADALAALASLADSLGL